MGINNQRTLNLFVDPCQTLRNHGPSTAAGGKVKDLGMDSAKIAGEREIPLVSKEDNLESSSVRLIEVKKPGAGATKACRLSEKEYLIGPVL